MLLGSRKAAWDSGVEELRGGYSIVVRAEKSGGEPAEIDQSGREKKGR
jgi:hypothetical protein